MKSINLIAVSKEEILERFEQLENKIQELSDRSINYPIEPTFLTVKEVCKLLKISNTTLHKYVKEGVLKKYGLPGSGKILFRLEDIEKTIVQYNS